jgi:ribosome-binding factor A
MGRSGSGRRDKRVSDSIVDEGAGHRHARLQDLVRKELEGLLRDELEDPRLEQVSVVGVVLSVDYRHARVHYTIARTAAGSMIDPRAVAIALDRASAFLRARLAEAVEMKRVPELRFVFDGEEAV